MATFVLVHGAMGGGWGWRRVAPLLRARGHDVYTPTLTGLGEREHLATPAANLTTHVTDIVNVLRYEDLHDIVLVGHSYGGMVITGVVEQEAERIKHLVYLDAMLPQAGQSAVDMTGQLPPGIEGWRVSVPGAGVAPPNETPEQAWGRTRLRPHPLATLQEALPMSRALESRPFTRTYVKATGAPRDPDNPGIFWLAADRVREDPAWRYHELPCGHSMHREMPNELVALLLELTLQQ